MSLYNRIKPQLIYFIQGLDQYNNGPFNTKIEGLNISVGHIYNDMVLSFNTIIIKNIALCLSSNQTEIKNKTFKGKLLMLFGKGFIGDKRYLERGFQDDKVFAISAIRDDLYRIMKRIEQLSNDIEVNHKTATAKTKHQKLGYLNAEEWYTLAINNLELYKRYKLKLDRSIGK